MLDEAGVEGRRQAGGQIMDGITTCRAIFGGGLPWSWGRTRLSLLVSVGREQGKQSEKRTRPCFYPPQREGRDPKTPQTALHTSRIFLIFIPLSGGKFVVASRNVSRFCLRKASF